MATRAKAMARAFPKAPASIANVPDQEYMYQLADRFHDQIGRLFVLILRSVFWEDLSICNNVNVK